MAHFAELDANNIVTRVLVVANDDCLDGDGKESEAAGISFLQGIFGADTKWVQTSYNATFRGVYAGIGYKYDAKKDLFIDVRPPEPEPATEPIDA